MAPYGAGSSPRVRGTPSPTLRWPVISTVHPRVCGEHDDGRVYIPPPYGSSPRVRGTRLQQLAHRQVLRFIPACAGNTAGGLSRTTARSVHPRVCGEHLGDAVGFGLNLGSSPRVRGTPPAHSRARLSHRFIPACAGNTQLMDSTALTASVHPRVCGEHPLQTWSASVITGSSPRVRGTRVGRVGPTVATRFIPACAGNTRCAQASHHAQAVHPRVCGEHTKKNLLAVAATGSSPRVRGTLQPRGQCCRYWRFIPACAGNTSAAC